MVKLIPLVMMSLMSISAFAGHHMESEKADIVDTAASKEMFSTLVAAVEAADLVDTLKSKGPFTVFAPTNKAFSKLPEGTVEMLLKPENKALLSQVLTYHVVSGSVMAEDVMSLTSATTVEGTDITVVTAMGKVMINDATVIKADVKTSNGVIHVIDTVLLPAEVKKAL
ncbi:MULTISPECIES: fasciclin domain-containing protein [Alteromonas]|uniref:Fasciclin domain-containing protein n=1 Tax=Alteromonas stellipolaris TaxID=233316 RepID=A0AAW7Z7A5_9ALTE|nr:MULTISPECIES: fasciclin domain-containing protein [Alteromonas]MDO6578641.1 fasciclin domain-containing protein [Alteromonas stellipolaris]